MILRRISLFYVNQCTFLIYYSRQLCSVFGRFDLFAYTYIHTCMNKYSHAHSVSRHIDAHHRAESIHSRMKERNIKLSRLGYTSLIRAWVGSEEEGSSRIAENYINEIQS